MINLPKNKLHEKHLDFCSSCPQRRYEIVEKTQRMYELYRMKEYYNVGTLI